MSENSPKPISRVGLILVAIPFVLLPIYFWFVFYFAIDSIVIPGIESSQRRMFLGLFFLFSFYPVSMLFLLPGACVLACRWTPRTLLRCVLAPLIAFALLVLLWASSMLLHPFYPNHLRAERDHQGDLWLVAVPSVDER